MTVFDWLDALLRYLALLVTLLGCAMVYAYIAYHYMQDCTDVSNISGARGKMSFNPIAYFDAMGSGVFPLVMIIVGLFSAQGGFLFGWSKNVFVDYPRVISRHGYNSAILLEGSGIFFHFFAAFLFSFALDFVTSPILITFFQYIVLFNIFFVFIKLCPILPYEGLRILSYLGLKFGNETFARFYAFLAPYQLVVFLLVFFTPLSIVIRYPVVFVMSFLL